MFFSEICVCRDRSIICRSVSFPRLSCSGDHAIAMKHPFFFFFFFFLSHYHLLNCLIFSINVKIAFTSIVFPCLLLAYTGQAAYILDNQGHVFDAFYRSIPRKFLLFKQVFICVSFCKRQ